MKGLGHPSKSPSGPFRRAGGHITASMELGHTEAIKRAVMAGLGIAFVSRRAVQDRQRPAGCMRSSSAVYESSGTSISSQRGPDLERACPRIHPGCSSLHTAQPHYLIPQRNKPRTAITASPPREGSCPVRQPSAHHQPSHVEPQAHGKDGREPGADLGLSGLGL